MKEIWAFSARRWGIERADRYLEVIQTTIASLQAQASRGRTMDGVDRGLLFAKSGRHFVIYRVDDATIHIARVLHDRMDPRLHLL